jgi:hypothetical protein
MLISRLRLKRLAKADVQCCLVAIDIPGRNRPFDATEAGAALFVCEKAKN